MLCAGSSCTTTPGSEAIKLRICSMVKGLKVSTLMLSEWPPCTGTRTVVAVMAMLSSRSILRVSFIIFISSLV